MGTGGQEVRKKQEGHEAVECSGINKLKNTSWAKCRFVFTLSTPTNPVYPEPGWSGVGTWIFWTNGEL